MNSLKRVRAFQIQLEALVFEERGTPEYPDKNLSEQRREPSHSAGGTAPPWLPQISLLNILKDDNS